MLRRRWAGTACLAALALGACSPKPSADAASQTADLSIYMPTAFKAAFGAIDSAPHDIERQGKTVTLQFTPHLLVDLGDNHAALISIGAQADCQDCGGAVAVHYLKRVNGEFSVTGQWFDMPPAGPTGDPPTARVRADLFDRPTLQIEAADRKQGCEFTTAGLYELTPNGPAMRARDIVTMRSNIPMGSLRLGAMVDDYANILPEVKNQAFVVRYRGTLPGDIHYTSGPMGLWVSHRDIQVPDC